VQYLKNFTPLKIFERFKKTDLINMAEESLLILV